MSKVVIICGPVGAGKTTYGRRLAAQLGGVFFAIDEWMSTLFLPDAPRPFVLGWMLERTARSEAQIWRICRQLMALDVPIILELGFYKREQRDQFRARARVPIEIHLVSADREVRRARVRIRNQAQDGSLTIDVDEATFDWAEDWFEPLHSDELVGATLVDNSAELPMPTRS